MLLVVLLLALLGAAWRPDGEYRLESGRLTLITRTDGSYSINIGPENWLNSGPTRMRANNIDYTTEDGSLKVVNQTTSAGADPIGPYDSIHYTLSASSNVLLHVSFLVYRNIPAITFRTSWPQQTSGTSNGQRDQISTSFPGFIMEAGGGLPFVRGWISFKMWASMHAGTWDKNSRIIEGSNEGLPVILFDQHLDTSVIISPLSNFMTTEQSQWMTKDNSSRILGFGLVGTFNPLPENFNYNFFLYVGTGINQAMEGWGNAMRTYHHRTYDAINRDFAVNYLGYWTDNGACYYYWPGESSNSSYQATIPQIQQRAIASNLPFRYVQIDSWWYYKSPINNGVKNWTAMTTSDMFPIGLAEVHQQTQWPIVAHNKFWGPDTDYATQNGGKYNFVVEAGVQALPNDPSFWDFLLGSSKNEWGLLVYEQDWLSTVWDGFDPIKTDVSLGRTWLLQMSAAAERLGITIQYCMPFPRHFFQAMESPAVTQIRVSDDYHPDYPQWRIGDSTILAWNLGIAPFKDNFRSGGDSQKCKYPLEYEVFSELETLVSVMSKGPVAPSDKMDMWDAPLLMRTCMADGRLLKPSVPLMTIDAVLRNRALPELKLGPDGSIWNGVTYLDGWIFHHVLAVEMFQTWNLVPSELNKPLSPVTNVAFLWSNTSSIQLFDADHPIAIPTCHSKDFQYYHISPVLPNGWVLLGEITKFASVSEERFTRIEYENGVTVALRGVPAEEVTIGFAQQQSATQFALMQFTCTIPSSGAVSIHAPSGACVS